MKISSAFFVAGDPKPKGSIRVFRQGSFAPDNPDMREWCHRVTLATQAAIDERGLDVAVTVALRFVIRRPKGHYGAAGRVRPTAPPKPHRKPDIDKLARAVLDAITASGVWIDDAQVVRLEAEKNYGAEPGVHVLVESHSNGDRP